MSRILSMMVYTVWKNSSTDFFLGPKVPRIAPKTIQKKMMPRVAVPSLENNYFFIFNYNNLGNTFY